MSNWIDVNKKLPGCNVNVMAICNNKIVIATRIHDTDEWLWAVANDYGYLGDIRVAETFINDDYPITHWMSIPEIDV